MRGHGKEGGVKEEEGVKRGQIQGMGKQKNIMEEWRMNKKALRNNHVTK